MKYINAERKINDFLNMNILNISKLSELSGVNRNTIYRAKDGEMIKQETWEKIEKIIKTAEKLKKIKGDD